MILALSMLLVEVELVELIVNLNRGFFQIFKSLDATGVNQPPANGVLETLNICGHSELIRLGVISVPYPIILSLNWLHHHNPVVDWAHSQLSLSCCGTDFSVTVPVIGEGPHLTSSGSQFSALQHPSWA